MISKKKKKKKHTFVQVDYVFLGEWLNYKLFQTKMIVHAKKYMFLNI